jgi:hypothetical protein
MGRRHAQELQNLKEQLAIEKESWEDMFMRKQQANLRDKVGPLTAHLCLK